LLKRNSFLKEPVSILKGIGPKKAEVLKNEASIVTIEDLLYYRPRRYIDRSSLKKIMECREGETVTLSGTVVDTSMSYRGRKILTVEFSDGTGSIFLVYFGNMRYLQEKFQPETELFISGKINRFGKKLQITHPEIDFTGDSGQANTGRIVPLYRSTEQLGKSGLDSRGMRRLFKSIILDSKIEIKDFLTESERSTLGLISLEEALTRIHFPESMEDADASRERLAFNEIFFFNLFLVSSKGTFDLSLEKNLNEKISPMQEGFIKNLGFELTTDQNSSIKRINSYLKSDIPMNILLQGDVGSGKTIVALTTALHAIGKGLQAALMTPTEVLAQQHYSTARAILPPEIRVGLITGSLKPAEKLQIQSKLKAGEIDLVIGTHSLFQDKVKFKNLNYIIIDEQHKFGVKQRSKLRHKGKSTNLLVMSATPIPRSLCLTQYGDLESINIKTKPANRIPINTLAFPLERLGGIYNSMDKYIKSGRQIFYVLPLIEDSETIDLKSAQSRHEDISRHFSQYNVQLLHGKMSAQEKDDIMKKFSDGNCQILVSTTVIEVGIDVPNANVMIIEHAERFGLAQLHQLRGRVGRGEHESFCILLHPEKISQTARKRIKIMTETEDGFKISEMDLKLRGSGELAGTRQHGFNEFEFIDITTDLDIIEKARAFAMEKYSELKCGDINTRIHHLFDGEFRTGRILSLLS